MTRSKTSTAKLAARATEGRARAARPKAEPALSLTARTAATARAENARKAEGLLAKIAENLRQVEDCFYEIGVTLRTLAAPGMWGSLGAASFDELVETRTGLSAKMAQRFLRIVEHYEERTAVALTQSKALALLTYVDATPEADDAETLAREDAEIAGVPISRQTVRGILEAASEARPVAKRKKRAGEDEARSAAGRLAKLLAPLRGVSTVRTVVRRGAFHLVVELPVDAVGALRVASPRPRRA